jgi:hypothetical protein
MAENGIVGLSWPQSCRTCIVEVGSPVARRPPHRSRRAVFPHQMWCSTFGALCGQLGYVVPSRKTIDSLGFSHSPHHIIAFN